MRRPASQDKVLSRIEDWRRQVPDLAIRSTFIVGFPGETEADFETLLEFVDAAEIDRAGCFPYENVVHADSRDLPGHVPDAVKEERWHRFMETQSRVSARRMAAKVGRTLETIIDGIDDETGLYLGRTQADAPEVDGVVRLRADRDLAPGEIVPVKITGADTYDLDGELSEQLPG